MRSAILATTVIILWLHSTTSQKEPERADLTFACPPWFIPTEINGTVICTCGSESGDKVHCDQSNLRATLRLNKCMTFDRETNETFIGDCPLLPVENATLGYIHLPRNLSDLNEFMCDRYNREGQLCGRCKPGFSSAILTYGGSCVDCRGKTSTSWMIFFAIIIIPVTLFYLVLLFFVSVNVLSPYLNAFVLYAQLLTVPGNLFFVQILTSQIVDVDNRVFTRFFEVMFSIYGIWNLDFLRPFVHSCLTNSLSHVSAYYLEFVVGLYGMLLIIITMILIELHDRNFKPLVWAVLPFRRCFRKLTRNWDLRKSVIKALATFILLSYVKIGSVSTRAFQRTVLYNITGSPTEPLYFYFDANVQYLSGTHLPLAILAGIIIATVTLPLPILLFVYQFKFFQAILSCCCSTRFREGLRTFMEAFQGYYRDGSDGGRDYRFFASIYIIMRMVAFILQELSYSASTVTMLMLSILVGVTYTAVRPYKQNIFNIIDGFLLVDIGFVYLFSSLIILLTFVGNGISFLKVLIPSIILLPLVYITVLGIYWALYSTCLKKTIQRSQTISKLRTMTMVETPHSLRGREYELSATSSLPDRIINPQNYQEI